MAGSAGAAWCVNMAAFCLLKPLLDGRRKPLSGVNLDTNEDIGAEITSGAGLLSEPRIVAVSLEETTDRLSVGDIRPRRTLYNGVFSIKHNGVEPWQHRSDRMHRFQEQ